jgi:hypothetical protein
VLARLDEVGGVRESRVDWTGHYFLLRLDPEADETRVAAAATSVLGDAATRADAETSARELDAFRRGEPWMRAGETLRLSREEARIIAARRAAEAARAGGLDESQTRRLAELVEAEVAAVFERIHAAGGGPGKRFAPEWAAALDRVMAGARGFLTEEQAARVREGLRASDR